MGRDPIKNQTPDLFSTGRLDGSPSNNPPEALPGRSSRRAALPKDLPKAIRYLEDGELDWLLRVATEETKRRGRPMPMAEASPKTRLPPRQSQFLSKLNRPAGQLTNERLVDCNSRIRSGQDAMRGIAIGALDGLALRLWCRMWGVKPDADEAQGLRRAQRASNPDGARPGSHPITR